MGISLTEGCDQGGTPGGFHDDSMVDGAATDRSRKKAAGILRAFCRCCPRRGMAPVAGAGLLWQVAEDVYFLAWPATLKCDTISGFRASRIQHATYS